MNDIINKIKSFINYRDFFGKYLKLKKVGSNYMALCPFHADSNPSLSVDIERGLWYCFGCNKGGDVFNFVMEMEDCSFVEAVNFLAEELSLEISSKEILSKEISFKEISFKKELKLKNDEKEISFEIYKVIGEFYHKILKKSSISGRVKSYLADRKIDQEIIEKYKLGYSSRNIENLRVFCEKKGIRFEDLEKVGLVYKKGKEFVEVLAGRLVIPIFTSSSRILGFAGRSIDNSDPKYLNTVGLKKTETLYGINIAKEFVKQKRTLILVEGYFDVWALYTLGFKNVCAVMGTSLSNTQLELIKKYSNEVILCFDSDKSGRQAIIDLINKLVFNNLEVKVANFSDYKDPHELYMNDPSKLKVIIENPDKAVKYLTELYINQTDAYKKQEFLEKSIFPFFASIKKKLVKEEYIKEFCFESNLSLNYVYGNLKRFEKRRNSTDIVNEENLIKEYGLETYLLVFGIINFDLILKNHTLLRLEWFENKEITLKLYKYLLENIKKGTIPDEYIIHELGLSKILSLVAKIALQISYEEKQSYFLKLLKNLEKKYLMENLKDFVRKGDYEKVREIQEKIRKGV